MKKSILIVIAILIAVVAYSSFATHNWVEGERIRNQTLNDVVNFSNDHLMELTDMGPVIEYWIEPGTADELVMGGASGYVSSARTLYYSSGMLRDLTDDKKYQFFETAMNNLQAFFIKVNNRSDRKEILATYLDVLKQMDERLKRSLPIDKLTLADAVELFGLSGNLAYA
jgi:hypothetical protein